MILQFSPYILKFKEPAGTSRGIMTEKLTAFLRLYDENNPDVFGIGEAAIFPGLSPEADDRYFYKVMELVDNVRIGKPTDLSHFPSLQFGFEQAIRDFSSGGKGVYFDSPFIHGKESILINGLIWMGDYDHMLRRLELKLNEGFKCIKFKIGAIQQDKELELLKIVRESWGESEIEIRVDANGAYNKDNVMAVLDELAKLHVHSIEQPVKAGDEDLMKKICKDSPIPIALDEELIGKFTFIDKVKLLDDIKPQYIVLKPSLIGGFSGAEEWIEEAEKRDIHWWVTSALESNIGLNALAQWVSTLDTKIPQGLGTGALFTNNPASPVYSRGERLMYDNMSSIDYHHQYNSLDWRD